MREVNNTYIVFIINDTSRLQYFLKYRARCHTDWVVWKNTCFLFSTIQETWINAELHCRVLHAALLEIPDAETNEFVKGHLKSRDDVTDTIYFIGATDITKEGNWEWNGSKTPLVFTDWGHGQPDHLNHTENCLALRHASFQWHDYPCHDHHRFICAAER
ncbi:perlucin-like [Mytilus edulis]|uniref:perlucin-like n=1 Tax=Mytilus edulis TaxID=6550 RepID=UPI0039F12525